MNCSEIQKYLDCFFDGELDHTLGTDIRKHLSQCSKCRQSYEFLINTDDVLSAPLVVPHPARLDAAVMEAFKRHRNKKIEITEYQTTKHTQLEKNPLAILLGLSFGIKTAAFAVLLFVAAIGTAYQFGKSSGTITAQSQLLPAAPKERQPEGLSAQSLSTVQCSALPPAPASLPPVKIIKIPILKEKIVEKIIYSAKKLNASPSQAAHETEDAAKLFNLKDLQPIAGTSYRIIRKGDNNE